MTRTGSTILILLYGAGLLWWATHTETVDAFIAKVRKRARELKW